MRFNYSFTEFKDYSTYCLNAVHQIRGRGTALLCPYKRLYLTQARTAINRMAIFAYVSEAALLGLFLIALKRSPNCSAIVFNPGVFLAAVLT